MNTKLVFRIAWLFIICLLAYIFFVVFFLSPKINKYLSDTEISNTKSQFNRLSLVVQSKIRTNSDVESLTKDIQTLFSSIILGKSGYLYIFDGQGNMIIDSGYEFTNKEFNKIKIDDNKLLFEELKKSYEKNQDFEYNWTKIYDPNSYIYKKISWIEYNPKLDWYIASSTYKDDFFIFVNGINSLILNMSLLLFGLLSLIGVVVMFKVVIPINKMFQEVQKFSDNSLSKEKEDVSKDEIGFLANQFNSLLDQVETSKKTYEEQVEVKTKEFENRLYFDELTGLRNRTALEDDIKDNDFVSIVLIDIDAFDDINELYGFTTGNLVLIEVGKILEEFAEKYNVTAYRVYGNVYCLADKKMMGFSRYDEFITELTKLFKNRPVNIDEINLDIFINVTLGISIAQEEPIKTAGIALKKAKKNSMKFCAYNNEIDTKEIIKKSMYWREKIKVSIEQNDVVPFYQPILNREKEIVKYETLMRIRDINENGDTIYLSPHLFLDISVKTKQYLQLSNQIISKAFDDLSRTDKLISFNLSFKDILDTDFNDSLDRHFDKLDHTFRERVVFEILESDYITDYTLLEEFILKYRKLGVQIAIDDFGTGYSNFAHILKIRPNYIKIDGSLIKNINKDKNSYELVKSIVEFCKALQIKTVAEYIHSKEVFDITYEVGVDEFQGFYLGEPSPSIE